MGLKKWRKVLIPILSVAAVTSATAWLCACNNDVVANFVTYDNESISVSGAKGADVAFPEVSRDGYIFDGWYLTEDYSGSAVQNATYQDNVTYYAKWAKAYAVTFDADGGSLTTNVLYLKEGDNIYTAVSDYVPTKGEYQFGGWYVGDEPLKANDRMTTSGVTLTAKYKAKYTINVYLQTEDLLDYQECLTYSEGYALIDEEYSPELTIAGFTQSSEDEDTILISETKSENVFNFHYNRDEYTLILSMNNAANDHQSEAHYYGVSFNLPENPFEWEGHRFLGWATSSTATAADILTDSTLTLDRDTVLYAVWNVGYKDMFTGSDYLYLSTENANEAVLSRGGVDIVGTYDAKRKWYTFASTTTETEIHARLNDNGTFIFYSNRQGYYYLYEGDTVNESISIYLDNLNGIEYYSRVEGSQSTLQGGSYSIDENGYYTAEFPDGTTFTFILNTVDNQNVFRMRGVEYDYGYLAYMATYYPVMSFDGFGNVLYVTTSGSAYYSYTVDNDAETITITDTSGNSAAIKIQEYGTYYGYVFYYSTFDHTFKNNNDTLVLDGCGNASYTAGTSTLKGTYSYEQSYLGGYLITFVSGDQTYLFWVDLTNEVFENRSLAYAEYLYYNQSGTLAGYPLLVLNDETNATMYAVDNSTLVVSSTGTYSQDGNTYVYVPTEAIDWNGGTATSLVFCLDTTSTSYQVYYVVTVVNNDQTTDLSTVYMNTDGSTLTLVSRFAIYTSADQKTVVVGTYTTYTSYIRVTSNSTYYYFTLTQGDTNTFETLSGAPLVLRMRKNNTTTNTTTLTITGKVVDEKSVATYSYKDSASGETVSVEGYFTTTIIDTFGGSNYYVYTFIANDNSVESFKFTLSYGGYYYYFAPYALDETITFTTYTQIDDADAENTSTKLALTDKTNSEGKYLLCYTSEEATLWGTFSSQTVNAFSEYTATVYTFVATEGNTTFDFTLLNTYFRVCGQDAIYYAADGSTLTLNGATHIARYVDKNSQITDNYYLVSTSNLSSEEKAIGMYIDEVYRYFDLQEATKSFVLRGAEAATYLVVKNNAMLDYAIRLDGHGNALILSGSEEAGTYQEVEATYTINGSVYTVVFENGNYVGELGTYTYNNTTYHTFLLRQNGIAGSYLNEDDLTVLVLDSVGNAVKYSTIGVKDTGSYYVISDTLFYYVNDDTTEAAMYTYSDDGKIVAADYNATYYADDFSSIVFYVKGVVLFNNSNTKYFSYDAKKQLITLYTLSTSSEANSYGYLVEEFPIENDTITYTDPTTNVERTYSYFDGTYVTLRDDDGNTLVFQPTGAATFTTVATYTKSGEDSSTSYYVVVDYEDNSVYTYLAEIKNSAFDGTSYAYTLTYNYDLEMNFSRKTFKFSQDNCQFGLTAYDYTYLRNLATYGSAYASIFASQYGAINIVGVTENGVTTYNVSGYLAYVKDSTNTAITFTNGTLSKAGYYNSYYGHMFTTEFVVNGNEKYHMTFFIVANSTFGVYSFIVYSCTKVTGETVLADDTIIYNEQFVYTTGFQFPKSTNEATGEVTYYASGDEFYPSIRYKGETICSVNWYNIGETTKVFYSRVYNGSSYEDFYYYFTFEYDDDSQIKNGAVQKLMSKQFTTADNTVVYALVDVETGEVVEVYGLKFGNADAQDVDCEKNENGSFTVTTSDEKTYTVTFTTVEGTTTVTVTSQD